MKRIRKREFNDVSAEVNLSPLIDIIFILLIFFVVTSVFKKDSFLEIRTPKVSTGKVSEKEQYLFEINRKGEIFFKGLVIDLAELTRVVESDPLLGVVVRADKEISHGAVLKVVEAAQKAGCEKIYTAVEK